MKPVVLVAMCLPFLAMAQTPPADKPAPEKNSFVGGTPCRTCHPNVWLTFNRNPHFKSIASGKEAPENTGCEGCHGPAGNHVAAKGGKATIRAFSQQGRANMASEGIDALSKRLAEQSISEFELRVLFQMSANDSATLCDSPKASDLGLHRALLHNGQMGLLETFRPYATPEAAWLGEAARALAGA